MLQRRAAHRGTGFGKVLHAYHESHTSSKGKTLPTGFIHYQVAGGIATITLDRPEAANVQTLPMLDDLDEAWCRADDDPDVRVIVPQANGKRFSVGHDIRSIGDNAQDPGSDPARVTGGDVPWLESGWGAGRTSPGPDHGEVADAWH